MIKCTCILGHFLCPEAERLWDAHNAAYHRKDWAACEATSKAYNEHIDEVKND